MYTFLQCRQSHCTDTRIYKISCFSFRDFHTIQQNLRTVRYFQPQRSVFYHIPAYNLILEQNLMCFFFFLLCPRLRQSSSSKRQMKPCTNLIICPKYLFWPFQCLPVETVLWHIQHEYIRFFALDFYLTFK